MSKDHCEGCGHHFPSKEEGVVNCPQCGRPVHLHDKVQCPSCGNLSARGTSFCAECSSALFKICSQCEQRGPADANYCANDGGRLIGHKDLAARKGAEQDAVRRRKAFRTFLLAVGSIFVAWFGCISPVVGWIGQTGDGSIVRAVQLSQAQIQATQQAEIAQRTRDFDDMEINLGEVVDRKRTYSNDYWEDLHTYVEVIVENKGNSAHHVLLAYEFGYNSPETQYQDLEIPPYSSVTFTAEYVASLQMGYQKYGWDDAFFLARIEALDGLNRKDIPLDPYDWDWEIRFVSFGSLDDYPCDYGECR